MQREQRLEKRRDAYLARRNGVPSARSFGDNYHFVDEQGRQYALAVRNGQQAHPLRYRPRAQPGPHECLVDASNWIVAYVRLPRGVDWFAREELGRARLLYNRDGEELLVRVMQSYIQAQHRSGRVALTGLDAAYCNELLNDYRVV